MLAYFSNVKAKRTVSKHCISEFMCDHWVNLLIVYDHFLASSLPAETPFVSCLTNNIYHYLCCKFSIITRNSIVLLVSTPCCVVSASLPAFVTVTEAVSDFHICSKVHDLLSVYISEHNQIQLLFDYMLLPFHTLAVQIDWFHSWLKFYTFNFDWIKNYCYLIWHCWESKKQVTL